MQTMSSQSALWRGMQLFAGMLFGRLESRPSVQDAIRKDGDLVSWCSSARTRRGDELARQQLDSMPKG